MCPLRAEKRGLHPNLTCVHGDRECRNPIPGDVAETRGFASMCPRPKKFEGLPRATHCTDRAQTSGNMTPTVELCPPHPTFRTKVRARRDVHEETPPRQIYIYIYTSYILYLYIRSDYYIIMYNLSADSSWVGHFYIYCAFNTWYYFCFTAVCCSLDFA